MDQRPVGQDDTTLSELVDPSGRRPRFDGAAWVSQDGAYWWNGTAWQPIVRRRTPPPWGLIVAVVVILGVIAVVVYTHQGPLIDLSQYGATNTVIDGPTQVEFDYRAQDTCSNLTFIYTFYDAQGIKVGEVSESFGREVKAGQSYHFTVALSQPIDPSAARFTATPNCGS
jgi:hypothetical protein